MRIPRRRLSYAAAALLVACGWYAAGGAEGPSGRQWKVHDEARPKPPVVAPGTEGTQEQPGRPPSDAVVLFDGKDLSHWVAEKGGGEPAWKVENGYLEVAGKAGSIVTREAFGDCQLHVEWAAPAPPKGDGQARGNSGVKLMGRYEVQVLDSYGTNTYADGQAGALYAQYPPLVNASRPAGQWQTFDIIFHAPRFAPDGKLIEPATCTVLHNGVLVQDHEELKGTTGHKSPGRYTAHPEKLPLLLQDHGDPVRYRNIWIRPLAAREPGN